MTTKFTLCTSTLTHQEYLNDNIIRITGNDKLFGYAGDDKLYGEEGNDTL